MNKKTTVLISFFFAVPVFSQSQPSGLKKKKTRTIFDRLKNGSQIIADNDYAVGVLSTAFVPVVNQLRKKYFFESNASNILNVLIPHACILGATEVVQRFTQNKNKETNNKTARCKKRFIAQVVTYYVGQDGIAFLQTIKLSLWRWG